MTEKSLKKTESMSVGGLFATCYGPRGQMTHTVGLANTPSPNLLLNSIVTDSSEDRAAKTAVDPDWSVEEERNLVRKLDFRVLFPCCLVYFFAYLGQLVRAYTPITKRNDQLRIMSDRANIGNIKVLQSGTDDSISKTLHLVGRDFNWVNRPFVYAFPI